jgi:hypothetical protein
MYRENGKNIYRWTDPGDMKALIDKQNARKAQ